MPLEGSSCEGYGLERGDVYKDIAVGVEGIE